MTRDWEKHLEQTAELNQEYGCKASKEYMESAFELAIDSFDQYRELEEKTRSDDLKPTDLESQDNPEIRELIMDEITTSAQAEAYAEVYRDIALIIDDAEDLQQYESDMRDLVERRQKISEQDMREIDRFADLDAPENIPVEIIEQRLDPVLDQVVEKYG